ncbi:hypothetical protein CALCODRAFT_50949 [Calocera cornea HHB12733]|uniref:CDP-diacylglycerol--glycerol-3-phosphate 3-phosphatidyltransferase n=1 Tax=Calocera cornea HHB12733 TaxID=1353952 RepID=A0A165DT64_9BASI|nr:hypothetical protein CALCODRAFT_50949 [Calocera cornea HHB12733]
MLRLAGHCRRSIPTRILVNTCSCGQRREFAQLSDVFPTSHPSFSLLSKDVTILAQPNEFYKTLIDMVKRAKRRIFISSLYIGTEEVELIETLHRTLSTNPQLRLSLLLDLRRSTRPGPSTAHMLLPLLRAFPNRADVHLFKSPKLSGMMEKLVPRRFDEGWGTWHAKVYGVDEEVMFSGANLNTSYFTDRQDRYLHFANQPQLAEYCLAFLRLFSSYSFRLLPTSFTASTSTSFSPDEYNLEWASPSPCRSINASAERDILDLHSTSTSLSTPPSDSEPHDTHLRPIIQAGVFNIREEERVLPALMKALAEQGGTLDLTSGYFALHEPYQRALIDACLPTRILAAGPKANGFYGSRGLSGRIPEAYTLYEKRFWQKVRAAGLAGDEQGEGAVVRLEEWEREGWTYHAKGMWLWPASSSPSLDARPPPGPTTTLFGSTNLNSRSASLDTELSFFLSTTSPELRTRLGEEVDRLWRYGRVVDEREWGRGERRVRAGTRALLGVMGSMM